MPLSKIKVIIDTNIWVSFLIGKTITAYFNKFLKDKRFEILSSQELYLEIKEVLFRPKFSKYIKHDEIENFLQIYLIATTLIDVTSKVKSSSDIDDDFLLALAKDGKANFLITGDKPHLLHLKNFEETQIISFSDFYLKFFPRK